MDTGRVIRPLQAKLDEVKADGLNAMLCSTEIIEKVIAMLKEDCHNCKLECLLQKYDELKEKYDALLKEQEAVEPIPPTDQSDLWKCGNCNHQLFRCTHQMYCEMCGRSVKWD